MDGELRTCKFIGGVRAQNTLIIYFVVATAAIPYRV